MSEADFMNGGEEPTIDRIDWDGETIDFGEALLERGRAYGSYVIKGRALPDVRDGLKPVQRRIIFAMSQRPTARAGDRYQKSAKTVGAAMGDYHPHGDSAIYDAMVRMAQSWVMTEPMIDGQGNWGNPDGDSAAAYRYCVTAETRVRLADGRTVRIADLAPGAPPDSDTPISVELLGLRGEIVPASMFFHSGDHPTLELRTSEGFAISGSHNHPLLVLEPATAGEAPTLAWKLLEQIAPGDRIAIARNAPHSDRSGACITASQRRLGVMLGAVVAEGWVNDHRAGFNNTDPEYYSLVHAAWLEHVAQGRRVYSYTRTLKSGKPSYELDMQNAAAELASSPLAEMRGLKSADKRIPELVWQGSPAFKRAFLQGLFEGDGSIAAGDRNSIAITLTTKSNQLVRDTQLLLSEFGIISRFRKETNRETYQLTITNRRDAWLFAHRVGFFGHKQRKLVRTLTEISRCSTPRVSTSRDRIPFLSAGLRELEPQRPRWSNRAWLQRNTLDAGEQWQRGPGNLAVLTRVEPSEQLDQLVGLARSGYFFATVTSVSDAGVQPVYSVRVDTEEHAFLAGGFVNHNTEARLSQIATDALDDLHPSIVPFKPNFDESKQEPVVLPVTFPSLLVNGTEGIAWAMACSVPPHNLAETIDAALLVLEKPEVELKDVMKKLPGPDFPTGGIVVNPEALAEAYRTGRGTFLLQAKYTIEQLPGNTQAVVVTELPYQVGPDQVVAAVVAKAREEKITDVTEIPKNLSDKHGTRIQIKCKRGGNINKLVADLMQHTPLRKTISVNMNVLHDGVHPKQMPLLEILRAFTKFRHEVVTGRLEHERETLERELHRLLALIAASDVIDRVVKTIRGAKDTGDAKQQLIKLLKYKPHGKGRLQPIDEQQADWILAMALRQLNQLNQFELREEAKAKGARIDEITRILKSKDGVQKIVAEELRQVRKTYGRPRQTALSGQVAIAASGGGAKGAAVVAGPAEPVVAFLGSNGNALLQPQKGRRAASAIPLKLPDGVRPAAQVATDSDQNLLVFTEQGSCFRVSLLDTPLQSKPGAGKPLVAVQKNDAVAGAVADGAAEFFLFVTEFGDVKRIAAATVGSAHAGGVPAFGVKPGDRIVAVVPHTGEGAEAIIATRQGKALRIELDKIRPVQTGGAGGVAGIKLAAGDRVASAVLAEGEELLTVHVSGMAKRVPLAEYPVKGRGTGGVQSADPSKPTRNPAGDVAFVATLTGGEPLTLVTDRGNLFQLPLAEVAQGARAVVAKPLGSLALGPGEAPHGLLGS